VARDPETIVDALERADEAATAFEVERQLVSGLVALGAQLLTAFFAFRAAAAEQERRALDPMSRAPQHWGTRSYLSVFGLIRVRRPFVPDGTGGGHYALDAELSLPARRYSDLLRDWFEYAATGDAYDQAIGLIERILGTGLSKRVLERLMAEDAADVGAFYAQHAPPPPADEGPILVVQADGKGVRLVREAETGALTTEKKEAVVTAVYTIAPHHANADAVADTLAGKPVDPVPAAPKAKRPVPVRKHLRATLDGKDAAFEALVAAAIARDGPHICHRVALTDGATALQQRIQALLPDFTLILDIVHVAGYLHEAATALLGESSPLRIDFVACRLYDLLTDSLDRALAPFEDPIHRTRTLTPAEQQTIATTIGYLRNNAAFVDYPRYLALGFPIATGVIEGACRHLVKDRMERAGMKWTQPGAQAVLDLRTVRVNGDWDAYQAHRRAAAHERRYGAAVPIAAVAELPETLALAPAA